MTNSLSTESTAANAKRLLFAGSMAIFAAGAGFAIRGGLFANWGIPTAWLLLIPFANIYWLWRWSQGVEKVTQGALSAVSALLLSWFLSAIGGAIIQSYFNKVSAA